LCSAAFTRVESITVLASAAGSFSPLPKFGDWMDVEFWLEMRLDAYRRVRMVI
jgi:hypothetical protein